MGAPDPADEGRIVLLAIAGDDAAFETLAARRQAWLRSLLRKLCGDATLADDLAQDALVKAWRHIAQLGDHRLFGPWLRRIALRTWLDWLRKRRLHPEDPDDTEIENMPSPQQDMQAADQRLDLMTAMAGLRPAARACALLFYGEGMSHPEIAAATGLTIGVVKSHIARATTRLRASLAEWRDA